MAAPKVINYLKRREVTNWFRDVDGPVADAHKKPKMVVHHEPSLIVLTEQFLREKGLSIERLMQCKTTDEFEFLREDFIRFMSVHARYKAITVGAHAEATKKQAKKRAERK